MFVGGAGIPGMVDIEISAMGQFVREAGSEPYAPLNDHIGDQLVDLSLPSATQTWTVRGRCYGNYMKSVAMAPLRRLSSSKSSTARA